jgi:hypothetical protein
VWLLLQVTLAKVDIDKVSEVAVQLSVSSIPAVFAIYKKETISKYARKTDTLATHRRSRSRASVGLLLRVFNIIIIWCRVAFRLCVCVCVAQVRWAQVQGRAGRLC